MDKYEYKIKVEEIKALIAEGQYQQAAEIADEIDWRKVKSVMMLCTVSDLYKINRRFEDSRDLLLLAYDRHPGGRTICYSLCELSIKMGEFLQAMEYYKEFVQIAPKDSGRYILQYKLYEAQDVSLEERIAVLEELKSRDYREKWAYELAYLYHRVGLATRCVEECDELILWFGDGKYVTKAMELKMLHAPLTQEQQSKYDNRFHTANLFEAYQEEKEEAIMEGELPLDAPKEEVLKAPTVQIPSDEVEIQVKTMDVGQYNTINLQKELAEGLKEILGDQNPQNVKPVVNVAPVERGQLTGGIEFDAIGYNTATMAVQQVEDTIVEQEVVEEVYEETYAEEVYEEAVEESVEETYVDVSEEKSLLMGHTGEIKEIILPGEENYVDTTAATVMEQMRLENLGAEPPKEMASVLSMEYDGQITFILPERENVEKQITGQLNIEDIMAEWERMKRENQEKNKEVLRKKVLEQTGPMFTEFEASIRDGVLEQLEKGNAVDIDAAVANMSEGYAMEDDEVEELAEIEELQDEVSVETFVEDDQEAEEEVFEFEEVFEEEYAEAVDSVEEAEEVVEEEIFEEEVIEEEVFEEEIEEETEEELEEEEVEETEEVLEEEEDIEEAPVEELEEEILEEEEPIEEEIPEEEVNEEEIVEDTEEELEEEDEETAEESEEEEAPVEEPTPNVKHVRALSDEEQDVYEIFAQTQDARERLSKAVDAISLASYTGNVVITGEESSDTFMLAKNMLHEVQAMDANFTGRIAKIKAVSLNDRDVEDTLSGLADGALIIHRAADLDKETVEDLQKFLQREDFGLIVVLEDTKSHMNRFLKTYPELSACFTSRMDLEALSEEVLVNYAKKYARDREFSIDELGVLALHTRIADLQTSEHVATVADVVEIMEGAIHKASKKNMGHFFDVVFAKRYDDEDMIILREKDFE